MRAGAAKQMCLECGSELKEVVEDYPFTESGLSNVVLSGITVLRCDKCKTEMPRIPRLNDLMRTIALALIAKPYSLAGAEVRFLRKFLGLTGEPFARLLDVDKTTLSKWETGDDPIGPQSDRLIRLVVVALGDGMKEKGEQVIRTFEKIQKRKKPVKLTVQADTHEYRYAA